MAADKQEINWPGLACKIDRIYFGKVLLKGLEYIFCMIECVRVGDLGSWYVLIPKDKAIYIEGISD